MTKTRIDKELRLFGLKNKLLITMKYYLCNIQETELFFFYKILDLLKQKYTETYDLNFIDNGILHNFQSYNNNNSTIILLNMTSHIYNCNNENLLQDLLESIDIGNNCSLEHSNDNSEELIIENKNVTTNPINQPVWILEDMVSLW